MGAVVIEPVAEPVLRHAGFVENCLSTGVSQRNVRPVAVSYALLWGALLSCLAPTHIEAQSLRGSVRSLDLQNQIARRHDFTYLRSTSHVKRFVNAGYLVPVTSSSDVLVKRISFPYTRPEVRLFIERLGTQYRAACDERLVVTSLTRPHSRQPGNASPRSVHPTGMAVDLRRSGRASCRRWLERTLLYLEDQNVLEATRERRPPHYHVAIFPRPYAGYVERLTGSTGQLASASKAVPASVDSEESTRYRVRRGDSLWSIARAHDTSILRIRALNDLNGSRIFAGQVLTVPGARRAAR